MLKVDESKCTGCGLCAGDCTRDVIEISGGKAHVTQKPCLKCWHCIAVCPQNAISSCECKEIEEYDEAAFSVETDKLLHLIKFRRSIRQYRPEKVGAEQLETILAAGRFSPTGCNRQPIRYIVLDKEMDRVREDCMRALKTLAEETPGHPAIPNEGVLKRFLAMREEYMETGRDRLFFNAPNVIILVADKRLGGRPLLDAGIAAANMELTAKTQGIGICYIGFLLTAAETSEAFAKELGIEEHEQVVACFTLGYPAVQYLRTVDRNPLDVSMR